jgi:hypothetical protein
MRYALVNGRSLADRNGDKATRQTHPVGSHRREKYNFYLTKHSCKWFNSKVLPRGG